VKHRQLSSIITARSMEIILLIFDIFILLVY